MLQTLFHIPHAIAGWPVFGLGWALAGWIVVCLVWAALLSRLPEKKKELAGSLPLMLLVAAMIAFVAPRIEEIGPDGTPLGVPIREDDVCHAAEDETSRRERAGAPIAEQRDSRTGADDECEEAELRDALDLAAQHRLVSRERGRARRVVFSDTA